MYIIFQIKRDFTILVKIFVRVMPFSGVLSKASVEMDFLYKSDTC